MSNKSTSRYLRVKRKCKDEPNLSVSQFKKCKFIASLESDDIEKVQNLLQINEINDINIIDIDQDEALSNYNRVNQEESVITCNGVPLAKHEEDCFVYDIYEYNTMFCDESLDFRCEDNDQDSDDENNECDYPDEEEYDYEEYDYYRDWQDEEDYKLKDEFEKFDLDGSSSEESLCFY